MMFGYVAPPFDGLPVHALLDRAVTRGGNDWGDVLAQLGDARAQLWLATDPAPVAAMVTRIDGDTMEVWLAGGAVLSGCVPFLEVAAAAAKDRGVTNGRLTGRKGWQRVLAPYGWHPSGDDLIKEWTQ